MTMKQLLFFLLLVPVLGAWTQAGIADISRALGSGQADQLGRYFDASVELSVLEAESVYNKGTAVAEVKKFFAQNPPKSFSQVHQGTSKGSDAQYLIGHLTTNNGVFRVYLYMKVVNGNYVIQELRFDEQ